VAVAVVITLPDAYAALDADAATVLIAVVDAALAPAASPGAFVAKAGKKRDCDTATGNDPLAANC
jgi:hypothetical protein